jgi:hypothetical protein
VRYIPKLLRTAVLIGLASAGVMLTSTLAAAAPAAADTQPPTPPYIHAIFPLGGCKVAMQILLSTDNQTPQNQIRYQVLSNGVPIPGQLLLAVDTRIGPPAFGYLDAVVGPAPTAQRFTIEAVDQAGNHSAPSSAVSRTIPGPCSSPY